MPREGACEKIVKTQPHPLVPADAGTHMWTAPGLQELGSVRIGSLAIICPAC